MSLSDRPRVIFMGTPEFAVPTLAALIDEGYDLVAVVTQPDRPAGRGRELTPSPVKKYALTHGLLVLQPETLRPPEVVAELASLRPDVIVVAAFGMILRPNVLAIPPKGCINVHASLLPRHRGASPIAAAILAGDLVTGVTIMLMDEGMDTGPILAQATMEIRPDDTAGTLGERLARQGADLLMATLPMWLAGELSPQPQPVEGATVCRPLSKEQGQIDWTRPAVEIERMVRAYQPWPSAFTFWQGQRLKILRSHAVEGTAEPGMVIRWDNGAAVGTGQGLLVLDEVQLAGRRAIRIAEFLRGQQAILGARLESRQQVNE
ncbi:MAG: methionyl-tRNA formyltransferase [Anaerolineae bacterium]|nr:methionyl-tRNA formyltransferase [Anaerolineae bacterium]MDW8098974.1 methionyl-tRNA formyltransferase [Anaerolineae bacterium]